MKMVNVLSFKNIHEKVLLVDQDDSNSSETEAMEVLGRYHR